MALEYRIGVSGNRGVALERTSERGVIPVGTGVWHWRGTSERGVIPVGTGLWRWYDPSGRDMAQGCGARGVLVR